MRGFFIGAAVFIGACYLYFNYVAYPTYYFRFKVTVEVQTPDGIKSATVVNENIYEYVVFGREFMPGSGGGLSKGEAIFIDLGHDKNLIVTNFADDKRSGRLADGGSVDMSTLAYANFEGPIYEPALFRAGLANARNKGVAELPAGNLPTLITLPNVNDYKSMQRVDPAHLDEVFGASYAISSVKVEITDEPLTEKIEGQLPWLEKFKNTGASFAGTQSAGPKTSLLSHLTYGSFKLDRK